MGAFSEGREFLGNAVFGDADVGGLESVTWLADLSVTLKVRTTMLTSVRYLALVPIWPMRKGVSAERARAGSGTRKKTGKAARH